MRSESRNQVFHFINHKHVIAAFELNMKTLKLSPCVMHLDGQWVNNYNLIEVMGKLAVIHYVK